MSRLIDADALKDEICKYANEPSKICDRRWDTRCTAIIADMNGLINKMPTIQPDAPRVMTIDEVVAHYSLPPVFVDDFEAQKDYYEDIRPLYFEFPYQEAWIVHWRGHDQVSDYLDEWKHSYNKKWRCWDSQTNGRTEGGGEVGWLTLILKSWALHIS